MANEVKPNKAACDCGGLPYPHRKGTMWCTHYTGAYDEYAEYDRPTLGSM
jgi:hypothetical protein